jgi:hypothetical protein
MTRGRPVSNVCMRAVLSVWVVVLFGDQASAHDPPGDMAYPEMCCGGGPDGDCKPIPESFIQAVPGGWLIKGTGEVISQALVLRSTDGRYHRCSSQHRDDTPTICLILPPLGQ